jgi:hypothetical protein
MAPRCHWTGSLAALIAPVPLKATDPPKPRARTWLQASAPARLELLVPTTGGRGSGQPTTTPTTVGLQLRLMTGQVMLRCDDLAQAAGGSAGGGLSLALVRGSSGGGGGNGNNTSNANAAVPWLLIASSSSSSSPSKPTCHLVFRFFEPADGADFAQGLAAIARKRLAAAAQPLSSLPSATATAALVSPAQRAALESAIRRAVASTAPADEALAALEQELAQAMAAARPTDGEDQEGGSTAVVAAIPAAASSSPPSSSAEQQLEALVSLVDAMWTEAESRRKQARPPQKRKAGQS